MTRKAPKGALILFALLLAVLAVRSLSVSQNELFLDITIEGRGEVVCTPEAESYHRGDIIELIAVPKWGYSFDRWEGAVNELRPHTSVRLKRDTAVVAVFSQTAPTLPLAVAQDPESFARSYLIAHMEALIQQRPELIDVYFDLTSPGSRETHMFETLRSRYVAEHLIQAVQGLVWYSDEIAIAVVEQSDDTATIRAVYSGLVQTNHMDEPTLFNDDVHEILLRRNDSGRWFVETDEYVDIFIRTFGRVNIEDFEQIFEEQRVYWRKEKER